MELAERRIAHEAKDTDKLEDIWGHWVSPAQKTLQIQFQSRPAKSLCGSVLSVLCIICKEPAAQEYTIVFIKSPDTGVGVIAEVIFTM